MTLIEVNTHFIVCISHAVITFSPITTENKLIFYPFLYEVWKYSIETR